MNEDQEWAAYVAQVNAVEVAKATSKNLPKKSILVLDADAGDMIQYETKS